jgi:drug/metabolite transporter (DMT)-like permease
MSGTAFALVLTAAVLHASWNVLAKRAQGGLGFIWLYFALAVAVYFPVAAVAYALQRPRFTTVDFIFIAGNGVLHLVYFILLQRGYRSGDLSLVYPLARGTGPLLSSVAAILAFGEHPSTLAVAGIGLIVIGIFLATGHPIALREPAGRVSIAYGIATGAAIAAYTLWDKHSVSALAISPIIYDFGGNLVRTLAMVPLVASRGREIAAAWRCHRREALGIAVLSPLAYLLVLWALITTPVSYVAPAREISILIGTVLGVRLFSEGYGATRIAAAALMLIGIAALAFG